MKQKHVKIPTIEQLPSGSYRCRLRLDGKSISITDEDYNTVYAKAVAYKSGILQERKDPLGITVGEALERYICARRNICSPSTIRGYRGVQKNRFKRLQDMKISCLNKAILQRETSAEAAVVSPKSLKNAYSLITSAIREAGGEIPDITLPAVPPVEKKFLDADQIKILMAAIKGLPDEVAIILGLMSCRRSEIYGLDWDRGDIDLKRRQVHIRRAVVIDENQKRVEKPMPKNAKSARTLPIIDQLAEALEAVPDKTGYVVKTNLQHLYNRINRICKKAGLPAIGVHGLRHSFASLAYSLGMNEKTAMRLGGWSTDAVMRKIYTHLSERDINKASEDILAFFNTEK